MVCGCGGISGAGSSNDSFPGCGACTLSTLLNRSPFPIRRPDREGTEHGLLIAICRGAGREHVAADGIDPQVALIVRLALDGLWFNALLGIPLLDDEEQRALIDRLRAMTRSQTAAEPNATNERSATIGR